MGKSTSSTRKPTVGSFKQHVTCSTLTGIAIGGGAYHLGFSLPTCLLSTGLCSMAGMLPDIDSDSSRSFQECIYFAAGLSAVLLVERLRQFDLDKDIILLSGAAVFLFVRFVVGEMIKKITVHRGMFHSIPAAVLSGEIAFFLSTGTVTERVFKASALTAGFLSHLILDEICSIDSTGTKLRLKKSFGTALKLFDTKHMGTALTVYAVVVFLGVAAVKNPEFIEQFDDSDERQLLAEDRHLAPHPIGGIFDFLATLESGAVSAFTGESKNAAVAVSSSDTASRTNTLEPLSSRNNAAAVTSPAIPNTPSTVLASGTQRGTEQQLFSGLKNRPTDSISTISRENALVSNHNAPYAAASTPISTLPVASQQFQPTSLRTEVSATPVRATPNVPVTTPSLFGLSGSDFAPRGVRRIPISSQREPAPVQIQY